jgi:hypothetical protein
VIRIRAVGTFRNLQPRSLAGVKVTIFNKILENGLLNRMFRRRVGKAGVALRAIESRM